MKIDHFNISGSLELLNEVKDFYCDIFEMNSGFRPRFSNNGYWLYSDEKPIIHLTESDKYVKEVGQGCLDHVAFVVDDLKPIIEKLEALNIDYLSKSLTDIGVNQIFLYDPAGVRVEVNTVKQI